MKSVNLLITSLLFSLIQITLSGTVDFKGKEIDSVPRDLQWCGPSRDVVLVLTETNSLYRSEDKGFTWKKLNELMTNKGKEQLESNDEEIGKVSEILLSPVDKNLVLFLGTHGINWISEDCGRKITALNHGRKVHDFIFHPTERNWILASAYTICEDFQNEPCKKFKEIYITQDLGVNWEILLSYVVQFKWGVTNENHIKNGIPKERILASYEPKGKGDQQQIGWNYKIDFIYSDDFFKTKKVSLHKGNKFLITDNYIFVAQVVDQELQEVMLLVSDSNLKTYQFEAISLNSGKFTEHSYTFLDTSENTVFLHINHFGEGSKYGHVYISDIKGSDFSLSLPYNVRSFDNQCDFEKLLGLEGIFIANQIDSEFMKDNAEEIAREENEDNMEESRGKRNENNQADFEKDYVTSMITFNKGGTWQQIKAPSRDISGKLYDCEDSCYLNLHGVSSDYPPFYTVPSAAGIILANGSVGKYLSHNPEDISTFLSRDGGFTWFEVRKGSHIYEIGDHGGLLVIADDQNPTDSVLYSWDEGLTWQEQRINDEKIMIKNVIIEPSSTALHFIVYGETKSKKGKKKGILVGLNFSTLNEKRCNNPEEPGASNSDYEIWTPSDGRSGHLCLLGRKMNYVRRKRDVDCYNGLDFERKNLVETCECTENDYECDEGFWKPNLDDTCTPRNSETHKLPIDGEVHVPPPDCNGYFTISKGYRKVPGDSCINGVKYDPIIIPCPYSGFMSTLGVIFFLLIVLILFGVVVLAFNKDFVDKVKEFINSRSIENDKRVNTSKYVDIGNNDEDNVLFDEDTTLNQKKSTKLESRKDDS